MARMVESGNYTICKMETVSNETKEFAFEKSVSQFIVTVEMDCTLNWSKNIGDAYILFSGESITVPCVTNKITITTTSSGLVRILGLE